MADSWQLQDGEGLHALDENQQLRRGDGYGVVDPGSGACQVTANNQVLGQNDTLLVAAGDVLVDGTTHSISQQPVGLDAANSTAPRRDVVYVDSNGDIQIAKGSPQSPEPEGQSLTRFEFFRPAPPDFSQITATVLAEIWIPGGASSVGSADIRDRRLRALGPHSLSPSIIEALDGETITPSQIGTPSSPGDQAHITANVRGQAISPQAYSARKTGLSLADLGDAWTSLGTTDSNLFAPAVIDAAEVFDSALDNYYLIGSPYQAADLHLFSSSTPGAGGWTDQGAILSAETDATQADGASCIYRPELDEVWLYYHEADGSAGVVAQYTMLATTSTAGDGTSWTKYGDPTPVLSGARNSVWDEERTYLTVRRQGSRFVGVYMGREAGDEIGVGVAWSGDGLHWETLPHPFGYNGWISSYDPTARVSGSPMLADLGGHLVVFVTDDNYDPNAQLAMSFEKHSDRTTPDDAIDTGISTGQTFGAGATLNVGARTYVYHGDQVGYLDWRDYL